MISVFACDGGVWERGGEALSPQGRRDRTRRHGTGGRTGGRFGEKSIIMIIIMMIIIMTMIMIVVKVAVRMKIIIIISVVFLCALISFQGFVFSIYRIVALYSVMIAFL